MTNRAAPRNPFSPGAALRERLARVGQEGALVIPGAPDPLVARLAESVGFEALYVSGAATSAAWLGLPDIGLATMTEMVGAAEQIASAVRLPTIADADTGYGNAVNVMRTVIAFERASLAGIHLEDQEMPKRCGHVKGKVVITVDEMVGKIRAAVAARRDPAFLIIARTDARSVTGFDDAVARGQAYLEAGADAVFPEALTSAEEFARYARELSNQTGRPLPAPASAAAAPVPGGAGRDTLCLLANMTEFGRTPIIPAPDFGRMGYSMVVYPVTALRVMLGAARELLAALKSSGSQEALIPRMLTRAELYDLLGYDGYTEWEERFVPGGGTKPL